MKKSIKLLERIVEYELKISKRARYARLAVYPGGELVVTLPWRARERRIETLMKQKAQWVLDKIDYFKQVPKTILAQGSEKDFLNYKTAAYLFVQKRIEQLNTFYQFTFNKISIRNQTTRWGSCSRRGNLSFNYKIALLPPELADYIIVHELCHLQEMNHSKKFWSLVGGVVPHYARLRKELKKAGTL